MRVAPSEARSETVERDESTIRGDRGESADKIPVCSPRGDADDLVRPGLAVADEHIADPARTSGDEVPGVTPERHESTVGGDRWTVGAVVRWRSARGDAHQLGRAVQPVSDENLPAVRAPRDEVRREALERYEAAVGGDGWAVAVAVPLHSGRGHADPVGRTALAIAHENVPRPVRVTIHDIGGVAFERDVSAGRRDRAEVARAAREGPAQVDTHQFGRSVQTITKVDTRRTSPTSRNEIGSVAVGSH